MGSNCTCTDVGLLLLWLRVLPLPLLPLLWSVAVLRLLARSLLLGWTEVASLTPLLPLLGSEKKTSSSELPVVLPAAA